ncbi:MAG: M20/M25/M40 family metallo-hydrolase [Acidobacteria bacterium]|nr:M20/M25/M40 family metallo-hydrolase [Acidobacteriota bacterium]
MKPLLVPALVFLTLSSASTTFAAGPVDAEERLAAYLRIETVEGARREGEAADFLARILREAGVATETYVTPSGHVQLAARLPATEPDAPVVVLLHHLDVVPAGAGWQGPPFAGEVHDDALWGRGAVDAKSLGIAHLEAFLAASRLPVRRRSLLFLAVSDEENGGRDGTGWLLERHPELFAGVEAVLNEGGANRTVLGRTVFWGIEVEQKLPLWLEIEATGRAGHGATLVPDNAAHELVRALARLVDRPVVWKRDPAARRYLEALGAWDPNARRLAENLETAIRPDGPTVPLQPGQPTLFLDTVQITMLEASDRPNVVAPRARARVDVRLLPSTDPDAFLAELGESLGDRVAVHVLLASPRAEPSPAGGPLWNELATALGGREPVVPLFISGITDSRYFRQRGIPAYGLSPFELEGEVTKTVHGPDERIPLAAFRKGLETMTRVVQRLVAPPRETP